MFEAKWSRLAKRFPRSACSHGSQVSLGRWRCCWLALAFTASWVSSCKSETHDAVNANASQQHCQRPKESCEPCEQELLGKRLAKLLHLALNIVERKSTGHS